MTDKTTNNQIQYLEFANGCLDANSTLWFCSRSFNSFFNYNLISKELAWKGVIPNEALWQMTLYRNCIKNGDKIFLIPYNAKEIAVYDISDEKFRKIKIKEFDVKASKFACATAYDNKIFVFGEKTPCVLILNCYTEEIEYYDKLHKELARNAHLDVDFYFTCSMVTQDCFCYLTATKTNTLVIFNMKECDYEFVQLGDPNGIYNNLLKKDEFLYLIPGNHRRFAVWDLHSNSLLETEKEIDGSSQYYAAYWYEESLYVLPNRANSIVEISMNNGELSYNEKDLNEFYDKRFCGNWDEDMNFCKFPFTYEDRDRILFFCQLNRELYILDKNSGDIRHDSIIMDEETRMSIAKAFCEINNIVIKDGCIMENAMLDVGMFVNHVVIEDI